MADATRALDRHDGERCRALLLRLLRDVAAFAREQQRRLRGDARASLWIHEVARVCDERVERLQRTGTVVGVTDTDGTPPEIVAEAMVQELLVSLSAIRVAETEALVLDEVENVESLRRLRATLERDEAVLRQAVRDGAGEDTQLTQLQRLLRGAFVEQLAQTRARGIADALHNEASLQFAWETIQDQKHEIQRLRAENERLTAREEPTSTPSRRTDTGPNDTRQSIQQLQLELSSHPYARLPEMEAQLSLLEAAMGQSRHTTTTSGATFSLTRDDLELDGESFRGSVLLPSHLNLSTTATSSPSRECAQCRRYSRAYVECHADNKRLRAQATADEAALARKEQAYINIKNEHAALTSALLVAKQTQDDLRRMVLDATDEKLKFQTLNESQQRTSERQTTMLQRQLTEMEQVREQSARERVDAQTIQEALENEVKRLRTSVETLEKERDAMRQTTQQLTLEAAALKTEAAVAKATADASATALAAAQQELTTLTQRLDAAKHEIAQHESTIDDQKRVHRELTASSAEMARRADLLVTERDELVESLRILRVDHARLNKETLEAKTEAERKLRELAANSRVDKLQVEQLRGDHAALQAENNVLLDAVQRLKQEIVDLKNEVQTETAKARVAHAGQATAKHELTTMKQLLEATRLEMAEVQTNKSELASQLRERVESEAAVRLRVRRLESERNTLVEGTDRLKQEVVDLEQRLKVQADESLATARRELLSERNVLDESQEATLDRDPSVVEAVSRRGEDVGVQTQILTLGIAVVGAETNEIGVQTDHYRLEIQRHSLDVVLDPVDALRRDGEHDASTHAADITQPRNAIANLLLSECLETSGDDKRREAQPQLQQGALNPVDDIYRPVQLVIDTNGKTDNQPNCIDDEGDSSSAKNFEAGINPGGVAGNMNDATHPTKGHGESRDAELFDRGLSSGDQPPSHDQVGEDVLVCCKEDTSNDDATVSPRLTNTHYANDSTQAFESNSVPASIYTWATLVQRLMFRSARARLVAILGSRHQIAARQSRIHNRFAILVTKLLSTGKVHALQALLTVANSELRWSRQLNEAANQKQDDLRKLIVEITNEKVKNIALLESEQQRSRDHIAELQRHSTEIEQSLEATMRELVHSKASHESLQQELGKVRASHEELASPTFDHVVSTRRGDLAEVSGEADVSQPRVQTLEVSRSRVPQDSVISDSSSQQRMTNKTDSQTGSEDMIHNDAMTQDTGSEDMIQNDAMTQDTLNEDVSSTRKASRAPAAAKGELEVHDEVEDADVSTHFEPPEALSTAAHELAFVHHRLEAAHREVDSLKDIIDTLSHERQQILSATTTLQAERDALHEARERLVLEMANLRTETEILKTGATESRKAVAVVERELTAAKEEIAVRESTIESLMSERREVTDSEAVMRTKVRELQDEHDALMKKMHEIAVQLAEATTNHDVMAIALTSAKDELVCANTSLRAARQQVSQHEETFVKLKRALKELSDSEAAASTHVLRLQRERDLLVGTTQELQQRVAHLEQEVLATKSNARRSHEAMLTAQTELGFVRQRLEHHEATAQDVSVEKQKRAAVVITKTRRIPVPLVRPRLRQETPRERRLEAVSRTAERCAVECANDAAIDVEMTGDERPMCQPPKQGKISETLHNGRVGRRKMHPNKSPCSVRASSTQADMKEDPECVDYVEESMGSDFEGTDHKQPAQEQRHGSQHTVSIADVVVDTRRRQTLTEPRQNVLKHGPHPNQQWRRHEGETKINGVPSDRSTRRFEKVATARQSGEGIPGLLSGAVAQSVSFESTNSDTAVAHDPSHHDLDHQEQHFLKMYFRAWVTLSRRRHSHQATTNRRLRSTRVSTDLHSVVHECVTLLRQCIKNKNTHTGDRPHAQKVADAKSTSPHADWTQVVDLNRLVWVLVEASKQSQELKAVMEHKLKVIQAQEVQLRRLETHCTELRRIVETYHAQRHPPSARRDHHGPVDSKWWLAANHPVQGATHSVADPRLFALEKERRQLNQRNVAMLERVIEQLNEAKDARRKLHERLQLKTRSLDHAQRYCRGVCIENVLLRAFYTWRLRALRRPGA